MWKQMAQGTLFAHRQRHVLKLKPNEDRVPALVYCIDNTEYEISCVFGEADPSLWENELIIQAMRRFLARGSDNHLIVAFARSDECKTPDQAIASLKVKNPKLIKAARDYTDKVQIYWTPIRPSGHYAIFDNSVMFESEHPANGKPEVTFIINRPEIARKWRGHFYEFIKYAHPLQVVN